MTIGSLIVALVFGVGTYLVLVDRTQPPADGGAA